MKTETGTTESGDVYTKYILYQDLSGSCQHTIGSIIAGGGGSTGLESFNVEYTDVKDKNNYIVPDDESTVYIPKLVEHLGGRGILEFEHNGETVIYDPAQPSSGHVLPHSALTVNYGGNVSGISESSVTYDTSSGRTITIPTSVSDITHGNLTIKYDGNKSMSAMSTPITYDPSVESGKTIDVPINVGQLIRGKFTIMVNSGQSNSASTIYDPSGNTEFNIDIPEPYDSDLTITYGADVKNRYGNDVYAPSSGGTVYIPTSVDGIKHGNLTINVNGVSAGTYDPGIESAQTIDIDVPESYNEKLTIAYGNSGNSIGSYNPAIGNTITVPSAETCNSPLVVRYGLEDMDDYDGYEESAYTPCEGGTIYIPTKIQDITNSAITYNTSEDCISISKNICMEGHTIVATSFYSTSDRNLKENIQSLLSMDAEKADEVHFKTFNFKDDETKTKTYGVIAQEVEGCGLNEIVHKDDNGNLSVDYISLLILKIANLENKVEELQSKVSELEKNNKQEGNN